MKCFFFIFLNVIFFFFSCAQMLHLHTQRERERKTSLPSLVYTTVVRVSPRRVGWNGWLSSDDGTEREREREKGPPHPILVVIATLWLHISEREYNKDFKKIYIWGQNKRCYSVYIYVQRVDVLYIIFFLFLFFLRLTIGNHQLTNIRHLLNFRVDQLYFYREKIEWNLFFVFFFCSTLPPSMVFFKDGERGEMREMLCIDRRQLAKGPTQRRERKRGEERIQLQLCKCPGKSHPPPLFSPHWIG